ncbi:MAG: Na+/H+ antiporter NhaA [Flavobacterium sp.]|jgi:NhaA family Na+:H+ antiporter|uniref:Na+/H+ antiporter NhaA n=1 Tax=Flavobacterium sp. TaxID=239 RepID=UPI0022BE40FE|nr:Na+/H+ antiporter NhaA [Flavobacterium sp.]MCZ8168217.1 Na+/H+ antiporter NhaA [Flavobacterium sp.]MCZ8297228.1 Na+/H+ antiporter NhaA [Flavobacterium sp.]
MKVTRLFTSFFESEKAGGLVLVFCTILSLFLANSQWSESYLHWWHTPMGGKPVEYWINDGLMAIFFLLIGLELEREVYIGELSKIKDAALPLAGALGGMLVPALLFVVFNHDTPTHKGYGIPMATDIAFAIGILSLLGKRVPVALKVFLTALAVIDDLGAILMIAILYTDSLQLVNLGISLGVFGVLLILNRLKVNNLLWYLIGGVIMWYFMLHSGVHATITGVLLAFAIPFENGSPRTISYQLQHWLHHPVAFVIIPIFALCNTAVVIEGNLIDTLQHPYSIGILVGLIVGKPLGIFAFSWLTVRFKLTQLPEGFTWQRLLGLGMLGGIGFTMSIFITLLAFDDTTVINNSKFVIVIASTVSGLLGYLWLQKTLPPRAATPNE